VLSGLQHGPCWPLFLHFATCAPLVGTSRQRSDNVPPLRGPNIWPSGRCLLAVLCLAVALSAGPSLASEQASSAGAELSQAERQRELEKLIQIVAARKQPLQDTDLRLQLNGTPEIGAANARLVIAEFSSYRCGYCRRHFLETMPRIVTDLIDRGVVRYAFFDYAVASSHPPDRDAAEAGRCAAEQGRYLAMRDHLFQHIQVPLQDRLLPVSVAPSLDTDALADCIQRAQSLTAVADDLRQARAFGIRGTPSFLLGYPSENGAEVRVVKRIVGAQPYAVFAEAVDSLLSEEL
jgi:protein-disulfide isomerase